MTTIDASELWDRWVAARQGDRGITIDDFCRSEGDGAVELLRAMVAVESQSPPSPLLDMLVTPEGRRVFAGHELVRVLGQGGSGVVFLARRVPDDREVALKVLNPILSEAASARNVVLREAEIAARLRHPGIVDVLESGLERGHAWITSELCRGVHVDDWVLASKDDVERRARTMSVGRQAARALGHAHAAGIVHRDVKPQNVLVERDGSVRILDFGLARAEGVAFAISRSGDLVGTPLYMAPEQVRGDQDAVGPWTDVHALGLLLWELETGQRLADRASPWRELGRAGAGRVRLSRSDIDLLSPGLRDVVARCAEPDPRDRPMDGNELADELDRIASGSAPHLQRLSPVTRAWRRARRRPMRAIAAAIATAFFVGVGTYAWRMRPVEVHFDEERGGKTLWIDGELVGTSNTSLQLRPGEHTWRAKYEAESVEYTGSFLVESGRSQRVYLVLDPPNGCPTRSGPFELAPDRWAWLQVSTQEPSIEVQINGVSLGEVPGIFALRLPFGPHRVQVRARDQRQVSWIANVRDQQLHSFALELDPAESEWRTHLVYSPIDTAFRDSIVSIRGARLYYENQRVADQGTYVNRTYLGAASSEEPAEVVIRLSLGVMPRALELELLCSTIASTPGAWSRVELGWTDRDWTLVHESRYGNDLPPDRTRFDVDTGSHFVRVDERLLDRLVQDPARSDHLFVRFSCGGAPAGGSDATMAQILRTEALPAQLENGVLHWSPAFRLRVK